MTHRFQQGLDKEERANYLREKNRQRRMQLMAAGQYQGMEMHVQQNRIQPVNDDLNNQFLSEGM